MLVENIVYDILKNREPNNGLYKSRQTTAADKYFCLRASWKTAIFLLKIYAVLYFHDQQVWFNMKKCTYTYCLM